MKTQNSIEYHPVDNRWIEKLTQFFEDIVISKGDAYFHPHPLNLETAKEIASYNGKDLYFLQVTNDEISGYGMLRGWDEGYSIPSLGIVIHPNFRRQGLAKKIVGFLHTKAREKGAKKIMLKVYENNFNALQLYQNLGYRFSDKKEGQLVGYLEL